MRRTGSCCWSPFLGRGRHHGGRHQSQGVEVVYLAAAHRLLRGGRSARRLVLAFFLNTRVHFGILVSVTRIHTPSKIRKTTSSKAPLGHWVLQDAKARFSELVRKVRSEGPQHVTVHGRDEVVVISAEEFRRLKGEETGQALVQAIQASPHREVEITPERHVMPVRSVTL
jgi:prevent-host-death family protein